MSRSENILAVKKYPHGSKLYCISFDATQINAPFLPSVYEHNNNYFMDTMLGIAPLPTLFNNCPTLALGLLGPASYQAWKQAWKIKQESSRLPCLVVEDCMSLFGTLVCQFTQLPVIAKNQKERIWAEEIVGCVVSTNNHLPKVQYTPPKPNPPDYLQFEKEIIDRYLQQSLRYRETILPSIDMLTKKISQNISQEQPYCLLSAYA